MSGHNYADILFRWIHYLAGVAWIGHLYFFNLVNAHVAKAYDAASKKRILPELMPRALFWFRWGAMFTWLSGIVLILLNWSRYITPAGVSISGLWIFLGTLLGTIMWFNVWFVIWPRQRKIINGVKTDTAVDPGLAKVAGTASKANTWMSVPLLFTMAAATHFPQAIGGTWIIGAVIILAIGFFIAWHAIGQAGKVSTDV